MQEKIQESEKVARANTITNATGNDCNRSRHHKKFLSLFSGAGGLDAGFALDTNFRKILANEILEIPVKTYSKNFGAITVKNIEDVWTGLESNGCTNNTYANNTADTIIQSVIIHNDIRSVDFKLIADRFGKIDLIVGGPPCQDFSVLRGNEKRKGIDTKRGQLYLDFARALQEIQPQAFVFENVPGLKTANKGKALKQILDALTGKSKAIRENGYRRCKYQIIFEKIVDASAVGVPQKRKRLIIIGVREDLWEKILEDNISQENQTKKRWDKLQIENPLLQKYPLTPLEVFEGNTLDKLQDVYSDVMQGYSNIAKNPQNAVAKKWVAQIWNKLSFDVVEDYLFLNGVVETAEKKVEEKNGDSDANDNMKKKENVRKEFKKAMKTHREILKLLGYYGTPVNKTEWEDNSHKIPVEKPHIIERLKHIPPGGNHLFTKGTKWEIKGLMSNVYRRIHPLIPSPTIIAYGGGGTWGYHYEQGRGRLTNRERARLQSFPDWFLFEGNNQEVRAQIGEAVPTLLGYVIAKNIAPILE